MFVDTPDGYEIQVHDYNAFEAGTEVGMLVKPQDLHVMKSEYLTNEIEGVIIDDTHVELFGREFECLPTGLEKGTEVTAVVDFDKIEMTDDPADGFAEAQIHFILYKGDHFHLTLKCEGGKRIYVDTNDVWEDYDEVGFKIKAEDIRIIKK
jgi:spermidine/putrescine transport system ATP-binding protein